MCLASNSNCFVFFYKEKKVQFLSLNIWCFLCSTVDILESIRCAFLFFTFYTVCHDFRIRVVNKSFNLCWQYYVYSWFTQRNSSLFTVLMLNWLGYRKWIRIRVQRLCRRLKHKTRTNWELLISDLTHFSQILAQSQRFRKMQ